MVTLISRGESIWSVKLALRGAWSGKTRRTASAVGASPSGGAAGEAAVPLRVVLVPTAISNTATIKVTTSTLLVTRFATYRNRYTKITQMINNYLHSLQNYLQK